MRRWWSVLFLALVPLIPLWRAVFTGESIGAFDQIRQMSPWNAAAPERPWDVLQADSVLQFYPWRDMVFQAWGKGQMPLWNPYVLAGTPLLANSQSAGFYPPHILMGVLHVPTGPAMTFLAWLHLFWAGLGVFVLSRRLGASDVGAVVGASSFSLSAFMVAWTALPSVISTVAWIPWCLWGVCGVAALRRVESGSGAAPQPGQRSHWGEAALLALCVGMMFLAGHLQFAAYGCMAIVVTALVLAFSSERRWRGLLLTGVGLALGGMLAAPQLLPVLRYSEFSHRRNVPTAEGYQAYLGGAIKPFELATLVSPMALGDPTQPAGMDGLEGVSEYWPSLVKQGGNFAESAVWIGPMVLALLILAPWRDRRLWPFAVLGALALLLALGTALNWPLYFWVPGWSSTGSPGRIVVLFVMAACVVGALAWPTQPKSISQRRLVAVIATTFAIGLALPFLGIALAPPAGAEPITQLQRWVGFWSLPMTLLWIGLSMAGLAIGALREYRMSGYWGVTLPLVMFVGIVGSLVRTGAAPPSRPDQALRGLAPAQRVAVINENWGLLGPAKALLPPNTLSWFHFGELGGYDSLLHRDTKAMLDDINGGDSAPPANGNMMFIKPSFDPAKLAEAGVTEVWSRQRIPSFGEPAFEGALVKYKLPGKGRAYTDTGPARILEESYQHLVVTAAGPGKLVVKDRMMDGWTATVDGKGVPLPAGLWREVELPEGEHSIEFRYTPPGLAVGFSLCFASILGCGVLVVLGYGQRLAKPAAMDASEESGGA